MDQVDAATVRVLAVATLLLGAGGCAQPLMKTPEELVGKVDVYPAHGRQGLLLLEPQITFGPYRTVSIHRGIVAEKGTSARTGLFTSEEHDVQRQHFNFVLQGPFSGSWQGSCVVTSDRRTETQVVGVHAGTQGSGVTTREQVLSDESGYSCDLHGPDAERWRLEADEHLAAGTVRDAGGHAIADIQGAAERWTWQHPALEGNAIVSPAGATLAALQRSFDGAVYLSRDLDPKQKAGVGAICAALLLPGR
jgi:hypothetical protein